MNSQHEHLRSLASRIEALSVEPLHAEDYAVGPSFLMYSRPLEPTPKRAESTHSRIGTSVAVLLIISAFLVFMLITPVIQL